jgi:hypothetical protein
MIEQYFHYCQVVSSFFTAIAGVFGAGYLAGVLVISCVNIWAKINRINTALLEFHSWKMQRDRQVQIDRLTSTASKKGGANG